MSLIRRVSACDRLSCSRDLRQLFASYASVQTCYIPCLYYMRLNSTLRIRSGRPLERATEGRIMSEIPKPAGDLIGWYDFPERGWQPGAGLPYDGKRFEERSQKVQKPSAGRFPESGAPARPACRK
jgi:hypothetical protein